VDPFLIESRGASVRMIRRGDGDRLRPRLDEIEAIALDGAPAPEGARLYRGRGTPIGLDVAPDLSVVVRANRHGGVLRGITRDLYCGAPRPFREARLSARAEAAGVPTPTVLAAGIRRAAGLFHRGFVVTREVRGARDLRRLFLDRPAPSAAERRAALGAAGRAVALLHDAGLRHADLNLMNLLWRPAGGIQILDLDRARIVDGGLAASARLANLRRLNRSAGKLRRMGATITRADRLRFLRSYLDAAEGLTSELPRLWSRLRPRRLVRA
jgi:3-deoxy-D-manno-octulosonic acid kinase